MSAMSRSFKSITMHKLKWKVAVVESDGKGHMHHINQRKGVWVWGYPKVSEAYGFLQAHQTVEQSLT